MKIKKDDSDLVLGIWDGHDAGAALTAKQEILFAINEERLSRRKLEIGFPKRSIIAIIESCGLSSKDISKVAISTSDFSKTLSRLFPSLKEEYYLMRRRKKSPGRLNNIKKRFKYSLTTLPSYSFTRALSAKLISRELKDCGISAPLEIVDHHQSHAACALCSSGFDSCLVVTLDGIGDGLSGIIWSYRQNSLELVSSISGHNSLGIFFEHVTNLLHMRELEDEGKVMALANFTYPVPDSDNPLPNLFQVQDLNIKARYTGNRLYDELKRIYHFYPMELFAYFAQRVLEIKVIELISQALKHTEHTRLAYAGGLASNVKVNMLLNELPEVADMFVFPHMGDGGLAAGAALWTSIRGNQAPQKLQNSYLGPSYENEISHLVKQLEDSSGYRITECSAIEKAVAPLIAQGEIVLWFQGRMEFGPRALGSRSILALPNSISIKDKLNLYLKKRCWYQPFCPSILEDDAEDLLCNLKGTPNRFMTCAYRVKQDRLHQLEGVMNIDGTCRPQLVPRDYNSPYSRLLQELKVITGIGAVLNTSFNIHGEPIVCTPEDALRCLQISPVRYLALGQYLIEKSD